MDNSDLESGQTHSLQKHVRFSNPLTLKLSPAKTGKLTVNDAAVTSVDYSFDSWTNWDADSVSPDHSTKQSDVPDRIASAKFTANQPLGSEYDVLQIKVKAVSPTAASEDFFADMAPDIKPKKIESLLEVIDAPASSSTSRFNCVALDESVVIIELLLTVVIVIVY